jgi:hypothetical protein
MENQLLPPTPRVSCSIISQKGRERNSPDEEEAEKEAIRAAELKPAVRRLLMTLICNDVCSSLFRSAVISYYAMYSRERVRGGGISALQGRAARRKGTGDDKEDKA